MLTDAQARKAQPRDKDYKLGDSGGSYLYVTAKGFRSWRLKYRYAGREKRLVIGPYPEIMLAEARDRRDAARRLIRDGHDPAVERLRTRASNVAAAGLTFEVQARVWHASQQARWTTRYAAIILRSPEADVFPEMGALPLTAIGAPEVLAALRKIDARGSIETANRVRQFVSAVYAHAIAEGAATADPAASVGKR